MPYRPRLFLLHAALLAASNATADFAHYADTASVIDVEPITELAYENVRQRQCAPAENPLLPSARSLGEDIRRQHRLTQQQMHCQWVESQQAVERIQGYRVTYRYGGRDYIQYMQQPPGERISVNVALQPLAP